MLSCRCSTSVRTRLWVAAEARVLGRGGIAAVTSATGILGKRIRMDACASWRSWMATRPAQPAQAQRIRRPGAGRKQVTDTDPTLLRDLEVTLIDPVTPLAIPESPLRWTTKSVPKPRRGAVQWATKWAKPEGERVAS